MNTSEEPIYLLSPENPMIDRYADIIQLSLCNDTPPLTIEVQPSMLKSGDVTEVHNLLLSLQHLPAHIEEMLFSFEFKFAAIEGGKLYIDDEHWKASPEACNWFRNAGTMPMSLFYVRDREARFMLLAGDFMAEQLFKVVDTDKERNRVKIEVKGAMADVLCERLAGACYMMLLFCYGSGYDPKDIIESVIADLGLPVEYDVIYEQFSEDLADENLRTQRLAVILKDYLDMKESYGSN